PLVALGANAHVEGDLGAAQQGAVVGAEDAGVDDDAVALGNAGEASEPGETVALHGGVKVADEENVDVARDLRRRLIEKVTAEAEQVGGLGVDDACVSEEI